MEDAKYKNHSSNSEKNLQKQKERKDIIALTFVSLVITSLPFLGFLFIVISFYTLNSLLLFLYFGGNVSLFTIGKWSTLSVLFLVLFLKALFWVKKDEELQQLKKVTTFTHNEK